MICICKHGRDKHYVDYGAGLGTWSGRCLEEGCACKMYTVVSPAVLVQDDGQKKMMDFPQDQWDAWSAGYLWGQRAIADTLVQDEKARYDQVMDLLRSAKMSHGQCQPRTRKACTACNAQDELNRLVSEWKGFTITATSSPEVTA